VLLDFRNVRGENRRFKLLWVFAYLYEWIKARGRHPHPFGLIIDEFVALTQKMQVGDNPLAVELDEFIQQYMRSSQIWLTIGLQSPHQLDDQLRQTVLSLGTYLIGQAATMDGARLLADALYLRDPWRVKYWRPVYGMNERHVYGVIREQPEFLPLEEQTEVFATRIRRLKQYQFLLRPAVSDGTISTNVYPIDISTVTTDPVTGEVHFPDRELIGEFRSILAAKTGRPIKELLQEQEHRVPQALPETAQHLTPVQPRLKATTAKRTPEAATTAAQRGRNTTDTPSAAAGEKSSSAVSDTTAKNTSGLREAPHASGLRNTDGEPTAACGTGCL
jgi:hypothetical protein